jgi:hypothetical protein
MGIREDVGIDVAAETEVDRAAVSLSGWVAKVGDWRAANEITRATSKTRYPFFIVAPC